MSNIKNLSFLLTFILIMAACNSQPKKVAIAPPPPKPFSLPYDTVTEDKALFISGMPHGKSGCMERLDTATIWKQFSYRLDSGFFDLDTARFAKMEKWAKTELIDCDGSTPVFYPFGGPDILNANVFYPNASSYILIGLEPVGALPDLCNMTTDQVNKYLEDVRYSLKDVFKRSYFITGNMIGALKKSSINGSIPLLALFIERNGYNIISINPVGINQNGDCQPADSLKGLKDFTHGVKIDFTADTGRMVQSVFYFQTDISDEGLKKNPSFEKYLSKLPVCNTYLKAASYLMHGMDFSVIRNTVFEKSKTILQDDSGIAYRFYDKKIWDIHLYGSYVRPGKEFSWINETDLLKAYTDPSVKQVPFTLGYNWRTQHINLLYAVRK
jgi:hypothetical protein